MSDGYNFSQPSNGKICSCGRHHGVGEWDPERRAAVYKRMSERMPTLVKPEQEAFVADWEKHHRIIRYTMGVVGADNGWLNKHDKGKDIIGPIFLDPCAPAQTPDMFTPKPAPRVDIEG